MAKEVIEVKVAMMVKETTEGIEMEGMKGKEKAVIEVRVVMVAMMAMVEVTEMVGVEVMVVMAGVMETVGMEVEAMENKGGKISRN